MKILADEQIPGLAVALADLGEVRTVPASAIRPGGLGAAEVLCVRTVTRVNARLLDGSKVRVVAAASSGTDHIDKTCLEASGILLQSTAGCNGVTVAEHVLAALLLRSAAEERPLCGRRAGIIGCGHTGGALLRMLEALGVECVRNDPPLAMRTGEQHYRPLDEALETDIVSLHVPLTCGGPHPTHHLLNAERLARLAPGTILVNTSRGGVLDEAALAELLRARRLSAVLDVWEGPPGEPPGLLEGAALITPHIAGYSLEARLRATELLRRGLCHEFGVTAKRASAVTPPGPLLSSPVFLDSAHPECGAALAVLSCCDPRPADRVLRGMLAALPARRAALFEQLRATSPLRREFGSTRVASVPSGAVATLLARLGFQL